MSFGQIASLTVEGMTPGLPCPVQVQGKQQLLPVQLPLCLPAFYFALQKLYEEIVNGWKSCPAGRFLKDRHSSRWAARVLKGSQWLNFEIPQSTIYAFCRQLPLVVFAKLDRVIG